MQVATRHVSKGYLQGASSVLSTYITDYHYLFKQVNQASKSYYRLSLLIIILGGRVIVLREVVQAGEDDPREGDVLRHVEVEAEHVAQGLQNADRKIEDKRNKTRILFGCCSP